MTTSIAPRLHAPFTWVTGGKGGVGKTTVAVNLGLELARQSKRVLLVDLDLALADAHVLLRVTPERTLEDALAGRASFAECVQRGAFDLDFLPAGNGAAELAVLDDAARARLVGGLAELSRDYELVIGDSPAGLGAEVLSFAALADWVLVVTTPEPAALTDAYGLIKALDALEETEIPTPELFVNQAAGIEEAERTARKLREVCERFLTRSPRFAGWLPRSRVVREACVTQRPFALGDPRSLEGHCLRRLAERVSRLSSPELGRV